MKPKIKFHRPENIQWGRYHTKWFALFKDYLSNYFEIEYLNYPDRSDLGLVAPDLLYKGNVNLLTDTETIIENSETGEFIVLSFTEYFNNTTVHLAKNEKCKRVFLAHFSYHNLYYWMKRDFAENLMGKVSPWFFGWSEEFDVDYYRNIRASSNDKISDKMFWKGSGTEIYRLGVKILGERNLIDLEKMEFNNYLTSLCNHKVALSYYLDLDKYTTPYDHPGEFCYRDMEYVSLGVPFIRIEYKDSVHNGLYPNHHYISILREHAFDAYKQQGNEGVANLIEQKFNEVKNNEKFLNYISKNQIEWFDNYARVPKSFELTINNSVLKDWITWKPLQT